jgi:hypothetical protein
MLHQIILAPISLIVVSLSAYQVITNIKDINLNNPFLYLLILSSTCFIQIVITRIYSVKNHGEIIKLELRQRYYELTGKSFLPFEKKLRTSQILALKNANNDDLPDLIDKTIEFRLRSRKIKQLIRDWQMDKINA